MLKIFFAQCGGGLGRTDLRARLPVQLREHWSANVDVVDVEARMQCFQRRRGCDLHPALAF